MSRLKILSIDGGGTRGVIPATILLCLQEEKRIKPQEFFDLLAGTSTGGILCTGYAFGKTPAEMQRLYLDNAADIFYDSGWDDIRDGFGKNTGADYSNSHFQSLLDDTFEEKTLGDISRPNQHDKGRLMVCTFDLNPMEIDPVTKVRDIPINFRPRVYHSDFLRDKNVKLKDLCLMTSAGPTYFPIYNDHIDGGVSLNNPAMAALAYAINSRDDGEQEYRHPDGKAKGLGKELKDIKLLSLGCGTSNRNYIPSEVIRKKDKGDWGNLQWIKYLPDMLTETNMQASDYYVDQLLKPDQYKRIQLYFDRKEAPAPLQGKNIGLDVKHKPLLEAMVDYAEQFYQKEKESLYRFLEV